METNSKNFSAEESLLMIARMIREAQGKVQKNAFYFLLWGWVIALAYVAMFVLIQLDYTRPYLVWLVTLPVWIYTVVRGFRKQHDETASTHFDTISGWLWIAFGVVIFTLVVFGNKINYQLTPVILIIGALPTLVSGVIIRFRPLIFGGVIFWIAGIATFLVSWDFQPLIGAAAVVGGYLVPGYQLKNTKD